MKTPGPFTNYKLRLPSSAWHCQATSHIDPKVPIYVMAMIEISKACAGVAVEGCYGLTEAGACSDAAALSCKAELKGDKHIVNGTKVFISNGPVVRYCALLASTNLYKGVINLIVDWKETPGYKMGKIEEKMGIPALGTSELVSEDAEIPEANLWGKRGH